MKNKRFVYATALMALCAACGSATSPNVELAARKGREAAAKVLKTRPGSMEREHAILEIKATEFKIREAGDPAAADVYLKTVENKLDSAGVIAKTLRQ